MNKCKNCNYLYIKDFICGVCENPMSGKTVVEPDDSCKYFEWVDEYNKLIEEVHNEL